MAAFKDAFGREHLKRLSQAILEVYPSFDHAQFEKLHFRLKALEMKPRVQLIRDELRALLPHSYSQALNILLQSAKAKNLKGFDLWPYTEFVQTYGLDDFKLSLDALREFTVSFTSEWAVRPYLVRDPKKTLAYLEQCAKDQNEHVRRWASEGTRPRLPWGERLQDFILDPRPSLVILDALKFDSSLYVRKSVSNHLNDIAKDHPERVIQVLSGWKKKAALSHAKNIDWVIHRALRTLIKEGHSGALKLMGVSTKSKVELSQFKIREKKIRLGERMNFEFELKSKAKLSQKLLVDYRIHFVKANRKTSVKVFKLKKFELPGLSSHKVLKSHSFKKITTREYYPGVHRLEIQVNGVVLGEQRILITI